MVNPGATSPKSNIVKFFSALAGESPQDGLEIDDEEFIGCRYQIVVADKDNGYTQLSEIIRSLDDGGGPAPADASGGEAGTESTGTFDEQADLRF